MTLKREMKNLVSKGEEEVPKKVDLEGASPVVKQLPGFTIWTDGGIIQQNGDLIGNYCGERSYRLVAERTHLSPRFIHLITQALYVIDLGDVGGNDKNVCIAHDGRHFLGGLGEHVLQDISEGDLQAHPKRRAGDKAGAAYFVVTHARGEER